MAALVADLGHVESLTEQFGRQRLDQDRFFNAESLRTQFAANNSISELQLSPQPSAWLIYNGTSEKDAHAIDTVRAYKSNREDNELVGSDVSQPLLFQSGVAGYISSKRTIKRSQCFKASQEKMQITGIKAEISNTARSERDERIDFSSSSDDELRDLFLFQLKTKHAAEDDRRKESHSELRLTPPQGLTIKDPVQKDNRRKRYKTCRRTLKKKLKTSRPCLDLEKMLGKRMEDERSEKKSESFFLPIHQL